MRAVVLSHYVLEDEGIDWEVDAVIDEESLLVSFRVGTDDWAIREDVFDCTIIPLKNYSLNPDIVFESGRGYFFVHELTTSVVSEVINHIRNAINNIEADTYQEIRLRICLFMIAADWDPDII